MWLPLWTEPWVQPVKKTSNAMYTATIESPLTEVYFNSQGCKIGGSCFISRLVTGQYMSVQVGVHPVDTVKTRMQIQEPTRKLCKWKKGIVSKHIGIGPVGVDNGFFKGPSDLYRGVIGVILGTVPYALLYFSVYESMLSPIPGNSTSLDFQAWICKHCNPQSDVFILMMQSCGE